MEKQLFSFIFEILGTLRMGQSTQLIVCALTYGKHGHRDKMLAKSQYNTSLM